MADTIRVSIEDALAAVEQALASNGASADHAAATGRSLVMAEAEGNRAVGFAHLFDYLDALRQGRADGMAAPTLEISGNILRVDARTGLPHLGVDRAWETLVAKATSDGVALLALSDGFTCGALGYFARRLADDHGLAGLVAANAGPAVMPASGGSKAVFCTNPLAFAMPCAKHGSIVIDQSSTAGALVAIHQAHSAGKPIPEGWALDIEGNPTTDPEAALAGTLLPFGGYRGANIALMVELLAAGLTGGNWAHHAPPFNEGTRSPAVGLLIIAINPQQTAGDSVSSRVAELIDVMLREQTVHVPGLAKHRRAMHGAENGIEVDVDLWSKIRAAAVPSLPAHAAKGARSDRAPSPSPDRPRP